MLTTNITTYFKKYKLMHN